MSGWCIYFLPIIQNWRNSKFLHGKIVQIHVYGHEANITGMHLAGSMVSGSMRPLKHYA